MFKKIADQVARFFVGGLFIFSGLIKLNDPVGTRIKMEEYFSVFADDFGSFFNIFIPVALEIGMIMIILEIVLGGGRADLLPDGSYNDPAAGHNGIFYFPDVLLCVFQ